MPYQAIVYRVMIASPSDVVEERNIIREVINKWNDINSKKTNIVLLPVGWETHVAPETGSKPQVIINKRILSDCDLLIGVFWTKIGTRTEHYESGTIEEIEEHIKLGKPAMIYFSKEKVKLESIDQNQYEKLKEYKRSCTDRSIYREYNDKNEFRDRLYEHLQITINEHEDFTQEEIWDKITITTPKETSKEILSEEAKELLLEAAKDRNGYILYLKYMGGESIQTHGKQFVETDDPREIAKWESALDVLEANDLIRAQGYKRESFKITDKGYKLADLLSNNEN